VKKIKNMFGLFLAISVSGFMSLLCAQSTPVAKVDAPAIEVKMIQDAEVALSAEFQVALYETSFRSFRRKGPSVRCIATGTEMPRRVPM
jgi:hypothetical protein